MIENNRSSVLQLCSSLKPNIKTGVNINSFTPVVFTSFSCPDSMKISMYNTQKCKESEQGDANGFTYLEILQLQVSV